MLLLIKVSVVTFSRITLSVKLHIITFLSVKQNFSYVWFLGSPALGKLTLRIIFLSVKQNLSYVRFLGPLALGKLTLPIIFLTVKQNLVPRTICFR